MTPSTWPGSSARSTGRVLLVGHSYGGAVISVAGAGAANVVGLVYVAAFALDEGESFAEIFERFDATPLMDAVRPSRYPVAGGEAVELTIAPELYQSAFAADLPNEVTEVLAVSQRPFAAIFDDRAQAAAWKTLPSWAIVAAHLYRVFPKLGITARTELARALATEGVVRAAS